MTDQSFFDKNSATLQLKSLSGSKSCSCGRRKYLTAHTALTAHHFPHLAAVKQHRFKPTTLQGKPRRPQSLTTLSMIAVSCRMQRLSAHSALSAQVFPNGQSGNAGQDAQIINCKF
jgi:hypothetical protein